MLALEPSNAEYREMASNLDEVRATKLPPVAAWHGPAGYGACFWELGGDDVRSACPLTPSTSQTRAPSYAPSAAPSLAS